MQQPYAQSGQFNQPQYGMPPAPTADQQQFGQPMQPPGQQQISSQSNVVQIPNQFGSRQPIVITQGSKKKKSKTGQNILNALIVVLAVVLIVGIIALTIQQCKQTKEQADAQKAAAEAAKQNETGTIEPTNETPIHANPDVSKQPKYDDINIDIYKQKDLNNGNSGINLDSVNQSQSQSLG